MKDIDGFYQRLSGWMERRYMLDASQMQKERERWKPGTGKLTICS